MFKVRPKTICHVSESLSFENFKTLRRACWRCSLLRSRLFAKVKAESIAAGRSWTSERLWRERCSKSIQRENNEPRPCRRYLSTLNSNDKLVACIDATKYFDDLFLCSSNCSRDPFRRVDRERSTTERFPLEFSCPMRKNATDARRASNCSSAKLNRKKLFGEKSQIWEK